MVHAEEQHTELPGRCESVGFGESAEAFTREAFREEWEEAGDFGVGDEVVEGVGDEAFDGLGSEGAGELFDEVPCDVADQVLLGGWEFVDVEAGHDEISCARLVGGARQ